MEEIAGKNEPGVLNQDLSFDVALQELEARVKRLEDGKLPLEEALECFKEGIGLVKICNSKLKEAETIIRQLTLSADGEIRESEAKINKDVD